MGVGWVPPWVPPRHEATKVTCNHDFVTCRVIAPPEGLVLCWQSAGLAVTLQVPWVERQGIL